MNVTPGANSHEKPHARADTRFPSSRLNFLSCRKGEKGGILPSAWRTVGTTLPPTHASHCQESPHKTSHLTRGHRTGRNKGTNDGASRAQLSFPRPVRCFAFLPPPIGIIGAEYIVVMMRNPNRRWPRMGNQREGGFKRMLRDGRCATVRSASSIPRRAGHRACRTCSQRHGAGEVIRSPRRTSAGRGTGCSLCRHVPRREQGRGEARRSIGGGRRSWGRVDPLRSFVPHPTALSLRDCGRLPCLHCPHSPQGKMRCSIAEAHVEANTGGPGCHSDESGIRRFPFIWSSVVASMLKRDSKMVQSVHDCRVASRLSVTVPRCTSGCHDLGRPRQGLLLTRLRGAPRRHRQPQGPVI